VTNVDVTELNPIILQRLYNTMIKRLPERFDIEAHFPLIVKTAPHDIAISPSALS